MPPSDFFFNSWGYKHGSDYFFRKSVTPRSWIWSTVPSAGWPWSGKSSRLRRTTRNAWGITTASLPCSAIRRKATSKCCRSVHSVFSMQGPHHTHGQRLETCWACWALAEHGYPLTIKWRKCCHLLKWKPVNWTQVSFSTISGNYAWYQQAGFACSQITSGV